MSLVAGFFLFGILLLAAGRVEAQTVSTQYEWKGVDEARQSLESAVIGLYDELSALQPGTVNYNNKLSHAVYYRLIRQQINQGNPVVLAVDNALEVVSNSASGSSQATEQGVLSDITVDAALKQQLKNDAIDLLTL
ncbi:MAG: hypothetical protein OHK0019_37980 [Saprospiraceae bacterium]